MQQMIFMKNFKAVEQCRTDLSQILFGSIVCKSKVWFRSLGTTVEQSLCRKYVERICLASSVLRSKVKYGRAVTAHKVKYGRAASS